MEILIKEGFILNPNEKLRKGIMKMVDKNNGLCPCKGNTSTDKHCPCSNYKEKDLCCCKLYLKEC